MRVIFTICFIVFIFPGLSYAQNLIPDSSFEINKFVPMDFSEVGASNSWSIPSWGTSDLFCKCSRKIKEDREKAFSEVDVPQNVMGYQSPHSGTCYAGLFLFSHGDYREYLQTPLNQPLEKNKTYRFTMYMNLADYSGISIDQLGVCFMANKADYRSSDVIRDLEPVYMSIEREIGNEIKDWHRVSVNYKAKGGESYILFGSFVVNRIRRTKLKAPKEIKTRINQQVERDAYYFIDDVSLVETYLPELVTTDTEALEVAEAPEVTEVPGLNKGAMFTLKTILFQTNETVLLSSYNSELDSIVKYLNEHKNARIDIYGHADNSGNEIINKKLSKARAKAIADYLALHGIDKARIKYSGLGSSRPLATNVTNEGRQQNRRVEFILR